MLVGHRTCRTPPASAAPAPLIGGHATMTYACIKAGAALLVLGGFAVATPALAVSPLPLDRRSGPHSGPRRREPGGLARSASRCNAARSRRRRRRSAGAERGDEGAAQRGRLGQHGREGAERRRLDSGIGPAARRVRPRRRQSHETAQGSSASACRTDGPAPARRRDRAAARRCLRLRPSRRSA